MSRQEVKEERRQYEGDPLVRSRLRERMRDLLSRNMLREVPRADVVITNPTHYAIALQWDRVRMDAPTVLAKGVDIIAARIREVADENAVPRVENKPLARALYAEVEIGDTIPEKFYEVIATILAQIYSAAEDHGTAAATANLAGPAAVLTGGAN
jgi:flagellar biosynthetic protein FlhB